MACILLRSSAVMVHASQAHRKMDVTRERIGRILEPREILLSFQTGFNLVNAAVVCAILESISGMEPSSVITNIFSTGHRARGTLSKDCKEKEKNTCMSVCRPQSKKHTR